MMDDRIIIITGSSRSSICFGWQWWSLKRTMVVRQLRGSAARTLIIISTIETEAEAVWISKSAVRARGGEGEGESGKGRGSHHLWKLNLWAIKPSTHLPFDFSFQFTFEIHPHWCALCFYLERKTFHLIGHWNRLVSDLDRDLSHRARVFQRLFLLLFWLFDQTRFVLWSWFLPVSHCSAHSAHTAHSIVISWKDHRPLRKAVYQQIMSKLKSPSPESANDSALDWWWWWWWWIHIHIFDYWLFKKRTCALLKNNVKCAWAGFVFVIIGSLLKRYWTSTKPKRCLLPRFDIKYQLNSNVYCWLINSQ